MTRARRPHRDLVGALAIWCFALQGLVLSGLVTLIKFRADVLCDDDSLGACPTATVEGASACATALSDPWAVVLGLPLSIYSAAFYLVVAVLALLVTVGDLRRWLRPLLLLLAWVSLLVSLVLAAYSTVALRTLCLYCLFLHGVSLGFFVAARLMNPWGLRGALRQLFTDRRALVVTGLVLLALLTAVSVQRSLYRRAARSSDARELSPCEVRLGQLVDSRVLVPSREPPRLMAALFLDFACPHCRADFEQWLALQAASLARAADLPVPRDQLRPRRAGRERDRHQLSPLLRRRPGAALHARARRSDARPRDERRAVRPPDPRRRAALLLRDAPGRGRPQLRDPRRPGPPRRPLLRLHAREHHRRRPGP